MADIQKIAEELAKKALERDKDERVEVLIRVMSAMFDKAMAYTNLILVAGFAGFFAVWGSMKEHLSDVERSLSAFAITISLTIFIFWEVFAMVARSKNFKGLLRVLEAPPEKFQAALAKQQQAERLQNIWTLRIWAVVLVFTVVPALVAAAILIYSFGRQLWAAI
jgi:uncharacterized membrane protein